MATGPVALVAVGVRAGAAMLSQRGKGPATDSKDPDTRAGGGLHGPPYVATRKVQMGVGTLCARATPSSRHPSVSVSWGIRLDVPPVDASCRLLDAGGQCN